MEANLNTAESVISTLTGKLKAVQEEFSAAVADGKIQLIEAYRIVGAIIKAAADVLDLIDAALAGQTIDSIVAECEAFYDTVLGPIDITAIPNWLEPYFDALLRSGIRPAIEGMAALLKTKPAPTPAE